MCSHLPCVSQECIYHFILLILIAVFYLIVAMFYYSLAACFCVNFQDVYILVSISLSSLLPYVIYISVVNTIFDSCPLLFM